MTLDTLPQELKSGRILVATAAQENAGLYTYPGMDDDYRIVTRAGTVLRGDGESVPQPPSGHWQWFTNSAGERIADGAEPDGDEDDDETEDEGDGEIDLDLPVSALPEHACADCGINTMTLPHAHSVGPHPIEMMCCRCVKKRGYTCPLEGTKTKETVG